ncbi:MAG TPA: L-aspartate oxidase [Nitriliruptoraceae bacterium]|nr:L-aspartate oxidase [Nitriliruptoraceae bacterium]
MSLPVERLDTPVVVGSGVAGLSVALGLPAATVFTLGQTGSTGWAQGGIAAAVGDDDTAQLHARDTMTVSGGIAVQRAVDILTEGGRRAIDQLVTLGADFDVDSGGDLALGREAGHGRRRIVHADGDSTGAEVQRTLWTAVAGSDAVTVRNDTRVIDLVRDRDGVTGVLVDHDGQRRVVLAPAVVLATGGIGQVYRHTTNPSGVTGDGIAMAARVAARLADLEFVQFHPTALVAGRDPMPLLTEALRGEGATLVNDAGERFMVDHHPDAELAPRDVVARGIWWQRADGHDVWLDARSIPDLPEHFPTVFGHARAAGLDPRTDLLPVSPAAHYFMGGIDANGSGRTSTPGLWAVGEVASTGVHGANRLASNSLLEGLVYGAAVANDIATTSTHHHRGDHDTPTTGGWTPGFDTLPIAADARLQDVRTLMWNSVGLVRSGDGLWDARTTLLGWQDELLASIEGRVAFEVAGLIITAALRRSESRGSHQRADYPELDPFQANRNLVEPVPVAFTTPESPESSTPASTTQTTPAPDGELGGGPIPALSPAVSSSTPTPPRRPPSMPSSR